MAYESRFRAHWGEGLGSFFLLFFGCLACVSDANSHALGLPGVAAAWGLIVMALIYALGPVSGAHFNPAVTLAFAATGRFPWRCVPGYLLAQAVGGFVSLGILRLMLGDGGGTLGANIPTMTPLPALALEFLLSLLLAFVIMAVSSGSREQGLMAGVAIGATIAFEIMAGGAFSGASMNPLRSAAPALISGDARAISSLWIFLLGPTLGCITGALLHDRLLGGKMPAGNEPCCGVSCAT